jgi:hypothetical protein
MKNVSVEYLEAGVDLIDACRDAGGEGREVVLNLLRADLDGSPDDFFNSAMLCIGFRDDADPMATCHLKLMTIMLWLLEKKGSRLTRQNMYQFIRRFVRSGRLDFKRPKPRTA